MAFLTPEQITNDIRKGAFKPNIYLTNMSQAYFQAQDEYVAKSMFPMLPVRLSTAAYYEFSRADLARDNVQRKPQFGKVNPAQMGMSSKNYSVSVDQIIVGLDKIENLDFNRSGAPGVADPRKAKAKFIAEQMNIHLDVLFADSFFKSGVWTDEWEGGSAYSDTNNTFIKFSDANCDPIVLFDNMKTRMKKKGRRVPNRLGLGEEAFIALKNNPAVMERVKFGGSTANPASVNEKVLAELFGLQKVVVFGSTYNKAGFGEEEDMDFICDPKSALLAYSTDTPAIDEATAGYIFTWDMLGDGNYMPTLQWEGENGTHSEFMEGLMATDMRKTSDDLGIFLTECV